MSSGPRRKFAVSPAKPPNSDINVTPLVDVVLVLLIIFMVVTPLLEKDIDVKVPETEQTELVEEVPKEQLLVALDKDGAISINMEKISNEEYVPKLKRIIPAKPKGDRLVFFMADEKTNYGKLVTALDGARQAGAETLGMMTEKEPTGAAAPGAPPPPAPPPAP